MCVLGSQQAALRARLGTTMAWAGRHQGIQAALRRRAEVFTISHAKMIYRFRNPFYESGNITALQIHCRRSNTKYSGPPVPRNGAQKLALEISQIIGDMIRETTINRRYILQLMHKLEIDR